LLNYNTFWNTAMFSGSIFHDKEIEIAFRANFPIGQPVPGDGY